MQEIGIDVDYEKVRKNRCVSQPFSRTPAKEGLCRKRIMYIREYALL